MPRVALLVFFGVTAAALTKFQFRYDDFLYLIQAEDSPWVVDSGLQVLSVNAFYRMGFLFREAAPVFFLCSNLSMHLLAVVLLAWLLRRAGADEDTSVLAAALLGLAPGQIDLLLGAVFFQVSAAVALVFLILLCVDAAITSARDRRHLFLALAGFLVASGTFVKFPVTAFAGLYAWGWIRWVRPEVAEKERRTIPLLLLFAAALPLGMALPLPSGGEGGEMDKAGLGRLPLNVVMTMMDIVPELVRLVVLALVLPGHRPTIGPRMALVSNVLRATAREIRSSPYTRMAVLALLPFLMNQRYFASYYTMPAFAWLSAIEAKVLLSIPHPTPPAARTIAAVAFLLIPFGQFGSNIYNPYLARQRTMQNSIRRVTEGVGPIASLEIVAACDDPTLTASTNSWMERLLDDNGQDGIRWATGRHGMVVSLRPHAASPSNGTAWRAYYCEDGKVRLEVKEANASLHGGRHGTRTD